MDANDLLREDAEARRTALDVTRSFIVQAPAGSGKTELLVQRYLALLAVVEQPEALLAITFTRKAAAEMRNRILEALRFCDDPASRLRPETRLLAQGVLRADARQQWDLLRNPSRLRLMTIDALNHSLARRLPLMSGLGAGLGVEEDARPMYRLAAERLLQHLAATESAGARALRTLLSHLDNRPGALLELVSAMLARREAWLPVLPADLAGADDASSLRDEIEKGRAQLLARHLQALQQALSPDLWDALWRQACQSALVLASAGTESPVRACDGSMPRDAMSDVVRWQGLAEFLLTKRGSVRASFTSGSGVLPKDARRPELAVRKAEVEALARQFAASEQAGELLHGTRALPIAHYDDAEWSALDALLRVLRLAAAELKTVFAERRAADYPEFAAAARQALGTADEPTDTALALDARLRHVLVDEFQDTSEAQVRLLEALTMGWQRGDGRTLFLVGDPMQSIYRFRNAEVGLFLDVRSHGLGDIELQPLALRVNFRSSGPVVDWINQCFEHVLPAQDDVLRGAVRFAPSTAAPGARTTGGVTLHAFLRSSRRLEAQTVADLVTRRLQEDKDARVAILVQGRSHLVDIVAELARRSIPFQATEIDRLDARPCVLDLLALTRALAHLGDRTAWLAVLRAPWCGLTLADCHALLGDDRYASCLRLLQDEQRRSRLAAGARTRLERCLPVFAAALEEQRRLGLRDVVERAWHAVGGPAALADPREVDEARAYFDALSAVEAERPGAGLDLTRLSAALEELYAPARSTADIRVELLTIHKAKGLQFDTVIVPGLDRTGASDQPPLVRWSRLPGHDGHPLVIAPITASGAEASNPLHAWLGRLEDERLRQERRRLLYVAATRAEYSLHLLGTCAVTQDQRTGQPVLCKPADGSALELLWDDPRVPATFAGRLAEIDRISGEPEHVPPRDPILLHLPDDWQRPAPPAAPPIIVRERSHRPSSAALEFDWASETARHVGTVVHRELQRLARAGSTAAWDETAPTQLEHRFRVELAELGVPFERRAVAATRVVDAVRRTLADARGRWLLTTPHREAESELALTGLVGSDVVSVIVDRTFVDADGIRWIVDYKTSAHAGAGLDEFLDNERERYRPQLERYATLIAGLGPQSIRLGLYFPLLSAWREWQAAGPDVP